MDKCAQNLLTFLSLIVNIIGDLYDHSKRKRIFTWTINKLFIGAPEIIKGTIKIYYSSQNNWVFYILQKVGAEWKL